MFKAFLISFLLIALFFLAGISNIFAIIAHKATYYIAMMLVLVALMAAFVVRRKYADKGIKDEEGDK